MERKKFVLSGVGGVYFEDFPTVPLSVYLRCMFVVMFFVSYSVCSE